MDQRVAELRQMLLDEAQKLTMLRAGVEDQAEWSRLTRRIHALENAAMVLAEE